jgi:HD-GYP domain-containing protein (c-di-GMP phosphodiesterase class II)
VFIDLHRSQVVSHAVNIRPANSPFSDRSAPRKIGGFDKEIGAARSTQERTSNLIKTFIHDIQLGRSVDVQVAKSAVSECVSSVSRNPDAMMFLTQLRNRDEYTSQHSFNVCIYSIVLARQLGLNERQMEEVGTSALLHDMGKIGVPLEILNKEGRLTDPEFAIMKSHTTRGRDILMSGRNIFAGSVDVAYGHHEHLDGSGYPRGLQAHQINLNTKLVSVVDKYDAMTSDRVYQKGRPHLDAVNLLTKLGAQNQVDNPLVMAFISAMGVYPPGTVVEMSNGEVAVVIESNAAQRLRPQVVVIRNVHKRPIPYRFVDLAEVTLDPVGKPYKIVAVRRPDDFDLDMTQFQAIINRALA